MPFVIGPSRNPIIQAAFAGLRKAQAAEKKAAKKQAVEEPAAPAQPARSLHKGSYKGKASGQVAAKRKYVRSKALLAAVRTLPCMVTGKVGETEPAHSNWPQHGKAGRLKADDNRVAAIHRDLHRELDQGSKWSAEKRQKVWWDAHVKTVRELQRRRLWPPGVPVPQLKDFWA